MGGLPYLEVCRNYSNAIHMSNQEPRIVSLKPLFLLGLQLGRAIPYLIFVTGATGGARVNFLAGVNFYRFNAKNWYFRQILREKVAFFTDLTRKIGVFRCKFYSPKILPV